MVSVVDLFSIDGGWGLVWPRCATYSNGTGALAHPQGKPHGGCLAHLLLATTSCQGSSPKGRATSIRLGGGQHVTGGLEQLLLGHDPQG